MTPDAGMLVKNDEVLTYARNLLKHLIHVGKTCPVQVAIRAHGELDQRSV